MIGPTDLLHPPSTPLFKTFQVLLIYCLKCPNTTPEILGIGISNTQIFVCFTSLVLEPDIETTVYLYKDLAGL
jgi:hypothetical protein